VQSDAEHKAGDAIVGRILDVNKKDGIVDLSLKAALIAGAAPRKGTKKGKPAKKTDAAAAGAGAELEVGLTLHGSGPILFGEKGLDTYLEMHDSCACATGLNL
jgi:ribosomal protein S1